MTRERLTHAGPFLAALAALLGILLFGLAVVYSLQRQGAVDEELCLQTAANRAATRGIWEGARRLTLKDVTDPVQRAELEAFFDELLEPFPPIVCRDSEPVPVTASAYEPVSYTIPRDPPRRPAQVPAQVPCLPFIPATCPPPPSTPPSTSPPAADDPPQMISLFVDARTRRTVTLGWETAVDEEGIRAYRIYRDSVLRAVAGARARRARAWLPCGLHIYAVEAVDTSGQRDAMSIRVRRRC